MGLDGLKHMCTDPVLVSAYFGVIIEPSLASHETVITQDIAFTMKNPFFVCKRFSFTVNLTFP